MTPDYFFEFHNTLHHCPDRGCSGLLGVAPRRVGVHPKDIWVIFVTPTEFSSNPKPYKEVIQTPKPLKHHPKLNPYCPTHPDGIPILCHPERFFTFDLFGVHPERFFEFDMLGVHPDRELYPQKITPTRYFTCFMLRFTPTKTKAFLVTPTGLGGTPTGRESTPTGRGAPRAVFGPRSGQ